MDTNVNVHVLWKIKSEHYNLEHKKILNLLEQIIEKKYAQVIAGGTFHTINASNKLYGQLGENQSDSNKRKWK